MDEISPYDIFDISPSSSMTDIKMRYRQLVLIYHPDKSDIVDTEYFNAIQEAYKKLIVMRRDSMLPDTTKEYDVDENLQQRLDEELDGIINSKPFDRETDYSKSKFNKMFEEERAKTTAYDGDDGYKEFNIRTETTEYKDIDPVLFVTPVASTTDSIVKHVKTINTKPLNFILSTYDDKYSIDICNKNKISGGDLSDVFRNYSPMISSDPSESISELLDNIIHNRKIIDDETLIIHSKNIEEMTKRNLYKAIPLI